MHEGIRYYCDKCDFKAAHNMNLQFHIQIVHEGIRYECNECDFKATTKKNLKGHIERIHKGIRYGCDECDYKATRSSDIKAHKKTRHKNINPSRKKLADFFNKMDVACFPSPGALTCHPIFSPIGRSYALLSQQCMGF